MLKTLMQTLNLSDLMLNDFLNSFLVVLFYIYDRIYENRVKTKSSVFSFIVYF